MAADRNPDSSEHPLSYQQRMPHRKLSYPSIP